MAKLDESEGEVLSKEEMKSTKGGAGAGAEAEVLRKRDLAETSLQEEAILPISQPAAGATEDIRRTREGKR